MLTIGYCKATVVHIRVTLSHLRVTLGHLRVTLSHLRVTNYRLFSSVSKQGKHNGASSQSKSNFFIYLLWLSIAVDSISPIDHGEYDSKNGNNCCHDKFCHVENSFRVIGLDFFLVFRHLPLESMVVDNIIFFIEQLNNCEENNLPWSVQTFLVKPQLSFP